MKQILITLLLILTLAGCSQKQKPAEQPKSYHFRYVKVPMQVSPEEQRAYMRDHFWDKFDFADTLYTTKADTIEMMRTYALYVSQFVGATDQEPIRRLMQKASVSKKMFDYFVMLSDKVLHDPNSPVRSDELYIAVLEAQIASPYYDKYEKIAPEYDLRLAMQNRIGHKANNFRYTNTAGRTRDMYSVQSDFVIIYFNNPGCAMCRDITKALQESQLITAMQKEGKVKILAIYPDENLDEWHKHRAEMPTQWINGYDKGCLIERETLYNINAIPALYLLDREKTVLVKDSTNVGEIEFYLERS
jgi:hypothetical protein